MAEVPVESSRTLGDRDDHLEGADSPLVRRVEGSRSCVDPIDRGLWPGLTEHTEKRGQMVAVVGDNPLILEDPVRPGAEVAGARRQPPRRCSKISNPYPVAGIDKHHADEAATEGERLVGDERHRRNARSQSQPTVAVFFAVTDGYRKVVRPFELVVDLEREPFDEAVIIEVQNYLADAEAIGVVVGLLQEAIRQALATLKKGLRFAASDRLGIA